MAKANHMRTWATLAAILVAALLAAPVVTANASRGDVSSIAFTSDRGGNKDGSFDNIYRMNADGRGPARRLTGESVCSLPSSFCNS